VPALGSSPNRARRNPPGVRIGSNSFARQRCDRWRANVLSGGTIRPFEMGRKTVGRAARVVNVARRGMTIGSGELVKHEESRRWVSCSPRASRVVVGNGIRVQFDGRGPLNLFVAQLDIECGERLLGVGQELAELFFTDAHFGFDRLRLLADAVGRFCGSSRGA